MDAVRQWCGLRDDRWSVDRVRAAAETELAARPVREAEVPAPPPRIPMRPSADDQTFLYVITSGDSVKIGYAGNLYIRVSNLRVDNPHGVELVAFYEVPKAAVLAIEKLAHFVLRERHHAGEWFTVGAGEAREIIERLLLAAGIARVE